MRACVFAAVLLGIVAPARADYGPVERFQLENGLDVVLQANGAPFVAAYVLYRAGSADDPPGYSGLAHLTEHLMFAGTPTFPEGPFAVYEPLGAPLIGAETHPEMTTYFVVVPREALDMVLAVEADRMAYLLEGVTEADLETQRRVVENERVERGDLEGRRSLESVQLGAFLGSRDLAERIYTQDPDDLEAIRLDDVRWFFQRYYGPANATLIVTGGVDVASAREAIERRFGPIRGRAVAERTLPSLRPPEASLGYVVKRPFFHEQLRVSYATPGFLEADDAELRVLTVFLREEIDERTDDDELFSLSVQQRPMLGGSLFSLRLIAERDHDARTFLEAVNGALEELRETPVPRQRFARLRDRWVRTFMRRYEAPLERAEFLARGLARGRLRTPEDEIAAFRAVTPERVHAAARRHLDDAHRLIVHGAFDSHAPVRGVVRRRSFE